TPAQVDAAAQPPVPQIIAAGQEGVVLPTRAQTGLAKTIPIRMETPRPVVAPVADRKAVDRLPELIGQAACMLEISRRIRRVGQIESADGGTLFLDEIGEMPLALQSKLLRFVECSELQRVGDNETVKVDVRIVAATHRPLAEHAQKGSFRADLYYRLAVFLIHTPSLLEH